ncbi:MAG: IS4 family transposase, partial [Anaerolineales bacterium]
IFQVANTRIIEAYAPQRAQHTWRGHRLFGVDGTKVNLPPKLIDFGYSTPNQAAHYPQALVSCLYELQSRLPFDFDVVSHGDERKCASIHIDALSATDVVVYDRGYFSYAMLHKHSHSGIHAIFRLKERSFAPIKEFFSSRESDGLVTIDPSPQARAHILEKHPDLDIVPLQMRLLKYEIQGSTFCLGTTLVEPYHRYPLEDFKDVYHARWGIEELYKISKRVFDVEDFHSKHERGIKQELFAHFLLITMNRLFANQADADLNGIDLMDPSFEADEQDSATGIAARIQTNFKNCVHVIQRSLEELVLLDTKIKTAVQRALAAITRQYQKVRPGRSY